MPDAPDTTTELPETMKSDHLPDIRKDRTSLAAIRAPFTMLLFIVGVLFLGGAVALGAMSDGGWRHFFHSYLLNFGFFLSISLGALFFVATQYACRAGWSVTVRRIAEVLSGNLLLMAVLFVPILVTILTRNPVLYPWLDPDFFSHAHVASSKATYFNQAFFVVRCVVYFTAWAWLAHFYLARSRRQDDTGQPELTSKLEKLSAPALVLFAVTVSFASFDLLMSLDPMWFSTIFGLYYFSGAVVGGLAAMIVLAVALQSNGWLVSSITVEHYHELGKLLLGFIVFWGYMAFSQYMLIWYANIPEETIWYLARQSAPWVWVTLLLLFGHLLIPFLGLLPRTVKRERAMLGAWAAWMLVIHWVDIYWLIMPFLSPDRLPFGLIDIGCLIGMGALYLAGALQLAGDRSLVPLKDPRLDEALAYHNP